MEAIFKQEIVLNKTLARAIGVAVFIILTSLGAFVRIPLPFTPVPVTLQTFFVLLCGAFLGSSLAAISQSAYILLGILGLPIFSGAGSGLPYLFGPTGGYLLGFVIAALFSGRFITYAGIKPALVFAIFCLADLILLLSGAVWLKFYLALNFRQALLLGIAPFLAGDLLKALAATTVYLKLGDQVCERSLRSKK